MAEAVHLYRGTGPDDGQVLVTVWEDGTAEIAYRDHPNERWSPPYTLTDWKDGDPGLGQPGRRIYVSGEGEPSS